MRGNKNIDSLVKEAKCGNVDAQYDLDTVYYEGNVVKQSDEGAIK